MLDVSNGSQAEWEARACWGLPSRRPSQQISLLGFAMIQGPVGQGTVDMQTDFQADMQQENVVASVSEQNVSSEGQLGLHSMTKQAAATAALQKALSNIQYIATGSQKARAAVTEAAAEAESDALSQILQLDGELPRGCSQLPFDNGRSNGISASDQMSSTADMPSGQAASAAQQGQRNSAHKQMGTLSAMSSVQAAAWPESGDSTTGLANMSPIQAAAAAQLGLQPISGECSLAEESSSNGSHFSLDTDPSPDQTSDLAGTMKYAATHLVDSAGGESQCSQIEETAEHKDATLWSAAPMPQTGKSGDGLCLVDSSAALNALVLPEMLAQSGTAAPGDAMLVPQTQQMLPTQSSLWTRELQLPATSTAHAFSSKLLGSDVGYVELPSSGAASTAVSVDISGIHESTQASALGGIAGWQTPDATLLLPSQVQSASGLVPEAVLHQGWSNSDAPPHAALQPGPGSSNTSPPSEVMSLGNWAPPSLAQEPCEQPLSVDGCWHQASELVMEPSSQEAAVDDTADMTIHGSDIAWQDQHMAERQRTSLAGDTGNVGGIDTRALTSQVSKCSALCHAQNLSDVPDAALLTFSCRFVLLVCPASVQGLCCALMHCSSLCDSRLGLRIAKSLWVLMQC